MNITYKFCYALLKILIMDIYGSKRDYLENIVTLTYEGREQRIWKMPPSKDRAILRSKTYEGVAQAMADQWG